MRCNRGMDTWRWWWWTAAILVVLPTHRPLLCGGSGVPRTSLPSLIDQNVARESDGRTLQHVGTRLLERERDLEARKGLTPAQASPSPVGWADQPHSDDVSDAAVSTTPTRHTRQPFVPVDTASIEHADDDVVPAETQALLHRGRRLDYPGIVAALNGTQTYTMFNRNASTAYSTAGLSLGRCFRKRRNVLENQMCASTAYSHTTTMSTNATLLLHDRSLIHHVHHLLVHLLPPADPSKVTVFPLWIPAYEVSEGSGSGGHLIVATQPLHSFSVYEPAGPGGCSPSAPPARTHAVVSASSATYGCEVAVNAGFFSKQGQGTYQRYNCLGNIVSNGRIVQDRGPANVNFGILANGSVFVG